MEKTKKIIGIIGGLGPEATVDLYKKIVDETVKAGARKDQDHVEAIIYCIPETPDRTLAIQKKGPSPVPYLLKAAKTLEDDGVDFIIVPCNTAHYFLSEVMKKVKVPFLSMMDEAASYIKAHYGEAKTIGLLATTGTVMSGIYAKALKEHGLDIVIPDPKTQQQVMEAIYGKQGIKSGVKSELPKQYLKEAAEYLIKHKAQAIILGCTEIPLALTQGDVSVPLVDATQVLAEAAVKRALG